MARPVQYRILEYYETPHGTYEMWLLVEGKVMWFGGGLPAIEDRKLAYGLARRVIETDERGAEIAEATAIEDLAPDARQIALDAIVAEHFDAWEEQGWDWRSEFSESRPPSENPRQGQGWARRPERETGPRALPAHAPDRRPVPPRKIPPKKQEEPDA